MNQLMQTKEKCAHNPLAAGSLSTQQPENSKALGFFAGRA